MSAIISDVMADVISDVTGHLKKNARVSNDDIWFSLHLELRVSDLNFFVVLSLTINPSIWGKTQEF